jgi:iron complex outermembrane receptor protein
MGGRPTRTVTFSASSDSLQKTSEKMTRRFINRFRAVLAAASAGMMLVPTVARSQQPSTAAVTTAPADQAPAGGVEMEKVTVTGYLIPRIGSGPQPVTTLDQDFISKQADQTVSAVLQRLPQSVAAFNPITTAGNSFAPGAVAVGLRGLPYNATLVLVDGLRFPAAPFSIVSTGGPISFVDLNSFPLASIDRIEILKDGGSAIYGSDAVAGVVNLVLKNEYTGADLSYYYGIAQRGDYEVNHVQFTGGLSHNFGETSKLTIVTSFDFYDQTPIESADRPYSATLEHSRYSPKYRDLPLFLSPTGSFVDPSGNVFSVKPGTTGSNITAADFNLGPPAPNFSVKFQQIVPRETNYGGNIKLDYDATPWLKLYDSFIIQRNEDYSVTPNQGYSISDGIIVPANNPFNPFHVPLQQSGSPPLNALPEFGPWVTDTIVRTLRNTAGLTVQLPHEWFIDGSFTYGESDGTRVVNNSINRIKLQEALDGTLPGFEGQFFNPFNDESVSSPNKQFLDSLRTQQILDSRTDLVNWVLKAGGTVWELPAGPLTAAGGLEYRSESLVQVNDENSRNNNVTSPDFSGPQLSARRYIDTAYGQVDLPILGGQWSWPGARALEVVFSERYDDYSDFGSAAKPKVAVRYKPIDDLTIRATYAEGFIAPSLSQLFGTPILSAPTIVDPVLGTTYTTLATTGGNPNLKPETSYGYFAGVVWTPGASDPERSWWGWANGFTAYVDWYQIELRNLVGQISAQQLVNLESSFPGRVVRGPTGNIVAINATLQNLGTLLTDGFDFGASYVTKEYWWGKVDFELNASYIYNYSLNQFVGAKPNGKPLFLVLDQEDRYGIPDFKMVASLFYSKTLFDIDMFRTGFTLNYIDSEHDINDNYKGTLPHAALDAPNYVHRIGSFTTVDWQISYRFGAPTAPISETPAPGYRKDGEKLIGEKAISPQPEGSSRGIRKWLANTTLTFGINNIGDVKPPFSSDWYQGFDTGNTVPYGRLFYFQIDKKF